MNNTAREFLVLIRDTANTLIEDPERIDVDRASYAKIVDALGVLASEECDIDRFLRLHSDKIMYKILLDIVDEAKYRKDKFND